MATPAATHPERIGHYRVLRRLGEGGMGVVYAAHDERLQRDVAIKMIRADTADPSAAERLWREARAAAAFNHPNICQLYEIGEAQNELFIAMELLEGEPLAARIAREPMPLTDATQVMLGMLAALEAVHRRGLVHRDLKPSNVFLTPHGVKLLDFGLARLTDPIGSGDSDITRTGMLVGTPRYLSPEQLRGEPADARSDVFAAGAMLFEMLSGKPAFHGATLPALFQAVLLEEPPILGGSPTIAAVDRIIHRALAKRADRRYPSADAMANDLRAALLGSETGEVARPHTVTRLIVMPFRVLRPDPDTDFLAFSVPEAIACSLGGLGSLLVRSPVTAAQFGEQPDLTEVARRAEVDLALTGTLLRAGDQLRVVTQLVAVPEGTLRWSHTAQVSTGDVFQLQDTLAGRIVESLELPLSPPDQKLLRHDVPGNPQAYEYYLRANQLSYETGQWAVARDLYVRCLELDPGYAPAWARLGRMYRVIAAHAGDDQDANFERAQQAFERAMAMNPDLPIAHNMLTYLEVDLGRAKQAMVRLLERARAHGADPELFAGLVHACRYCGLLDASISAHAQARRLDPNIRTSVHHALAMRGAPGDLELSIELGRDDPTRIAIVPMVLLGREAEALEFLREAERRSLPRAAAAVIKAWRLALEGDAAQSLQVCETLLSRWQPRDPCTMYYLARELAHTGGTESAMRLLERSIDAGYTCFTFMARDPWLDPLRGDPRLTALLRRAEHGMRDAQAAFTAAGGERVLGLR